MQDTPPNSVVAQFESVPEGLQKLAGGEASPRAGTTGTNDQMGFAPEGRWNHTTQQISIAPPGRVRLIAIVRWFPLADSLHHRGGGWE